MPPWGLSGLLPPKPPEPGSVPPKPPGGADDGAPPIGAPSRKTVPLISNTSEDYEVVKSLLTAHYSAFEKNFDEDDHDDTDPTQKDYLFGAILRAFSLFFAAESLALAKHPASNINTRTQAIVLSLMSALLVCDSLRKRTI